LLPVIVMGVPACPLAGVKLEIVGAGTVTVRLVALVAVPRTVSTVIGPVVAPGGTVATTEVELLELTADATTPLKRTIVAGASGPRASDVPVMVTFAPMAALLGEKLEIVGGGAAVAVKLAALVAVPCTVVSVRGPVVAVKGIWVMVSELGELYVIRDGWTVAPARVTVAPGTKPVPLAVTETDWPAPAVVGLNEEIVGGLSGDHWSRKSAIRPV
jgi:hypothetical protein